MLDYVDLMGAPIMGNAGVIQSKADTSANVQNVTLLKRLPVTFAVKISFQHGFSPLIDFF